MTGQFWQPSDMVPCFFSGLSNLHLNSLAWRARILLLSRTQRSRRWVWVTAGEKACSESRRCTTRLQVIGRGHRVSQGQIWNQLKSRECWKPESVVRLEAMNHTGHQGRQIPFYWIQLGGEDSRATRLRETRRTSNQAAVSVRCLLQGHG